MLETKVAVKDQFQQILADLDALSRVPSLPARPRYLLQVPAPLRLCYPSLTLLGCH